MYTAVAERQLPPPSTRLRRSVPRSQRGRSITAVGGGFDSLATMMVLMVLLTLVTLAMLLLLMMMMLARPYMSELA